MASVPKKSRKARSGWVRPTEKQVEAANISGLASETIPPAYSNHDGYFKRLPVPARGEWLDEYNETGQSFKSFQRLAMKAVPHGKCRIIELVLVGPFNTSNSPDVNKLCLYAQAFFDCEVRIAKNKLSLTSVSGKDDSQRSKRGSHSEEQHIVGGARCGAEGQLQLDCRDIFDALAKETSSSSKERRNILCRVAITMADIYCVKNGEAWNFLFGQANAADGVGVFSFARYCSDINGDILFPLKWEGFPTKDNYLEKKEMDNLSNPCDNDDSIGSLNKQEKFKISTHASNESIHNNEEENTEKGDSSTIASSLKDKLLLRSCKVLTHETGHLFGLKHCIYYHCLMNGSNHDEESDSKPIHLCYICLHKLQSSIKFDPLVRARNLQHFYETQQGSCWNVEAEWNENWIKVVEAKSSVPLLPNINKSERLKN